jgi:mono/diheme cytochrome c family protein
VTERTLSTLSDRFMAAVALAALSKSRAQSMASYIEKKLADPQNAGISPEKRKDLESVVRWLRTCC